MAHNEQRDSSLRRIGLFGGTGFVGGYLVDALLANGVKPDGTGYQRTKCRAEANLKSLDLDSTIFRPCYLAQKNNAL